MRIVKFSRILRTTTKLIPKKVQRTRIWTNRTIGVGSEMKQMVKEINTKMFKKGNIESRGVSYESTFCSNVIPACRQHSRLRSVAGPHACSATPMSKVSEGLKSSSRARRTCSASKALYIERSHGREPTELGPSRLSLTHTHTRRQVPLRWSSQQRLRGGEQCPDFVPEGGTTRRMKAFSCIERWRKIR
jgi:hypothetical protein